MVTVLHQSFVLSCPGVVGHHCREVVDAFAGVQKWRQSMQQSAIVATVTTTDLNESLQSASHPVFF